ncbi:hypothetical protein ACQCT5_07335 [Sutcliffiella halmapala]
MESKRTFSSASLLSTCGSLAVWLRVKVIVTFCKVDRLTREVDRLGLKVDKLIQKVDRLLDELDRLRPVLDRLRISLVSL